MRTSALLRNVVAVVSGTAVGQLVAFAFSPLITRIYSPEVFGLQGVFLSLVSIFSPVVALRYPMAIVVAQDEASANWLAKLSLAIAFSLSCLLGLVLAVGQDEVLSLLGAEALGSLIWFLPLALFCVALQDIANFRAARFSAFRLVGAVTAVQSFLTNLVRVLGGLVSPVAGVLVAVTSISPATQAAMLRFGFRRRMAPSRPLSWSQARSLLKRHRDFPLYRMPTDVLNAASQSVPVILLASLFSPESAGLYTLARTILNLPSNIIGNAIGNVIYPRFAELARDGHALMPLLLRSTGALLILSPVIIGLSWFAPQIFALVFGEEWREAGYFARWMSLWIGVGIAGIPAVRVVPVINRQARMLSFNIVLLVVRLLSVFIIYFYAGTAYMAVISYSISSAIMNIFMIIIFGERVFRFDKNISTR